MIRKLCILSAVAIGLSSLAEAGILSTLELPSQTGAPGDTLIFNVTLTNPSSTDQIWLNGISSTSVSALLTIDTDPFFTNAPLFLDPLASSGTFELFEVTIDPSTPDGPYVGNIVSILGGVDGGTGTAFDDLADISFDVQVQSNTAAVPEPGTFAILCCIALATGVGKMWRRRRLLPNGSR